VGFELASKRRQGALAGNALATSFGPVGDLQNRQGPSVA